MHTLQTVKSVKARVSMYFACDLEILHSFEQLRLSPLNLQLEKWCKLDRAKMPLIDAIFELDKIIDESDPDVRINTLCRMDPNSSAQFYAVTCTQWC